MVALLGLAFLKAFGDGYVWTGGVPGREASGLMEPVEDGSHAQPAASDESASLPGDPRREDATQTTGH